MHTFMLIHSPLCGATTWQPVARCLRERHLSVVVPDLHDDEKKDSPLWKQQAESIADALRDVDSGAPLIWVAHSGAGFRLFTYRSFISNPTQAYIFVDAGIPLLAAANVFNQLDVMTQRDPDWGNTFRAYLESGNNFPNWNDDALREIIPDAALRAKMIAELNPRGLRYFAESIPIIPNLPDAKCSYLKFSSPYEADAKIAQEAGWAIQEMLGNHFHMLVDPRGVTNKLIEMANDD
jgi:hypothetical protein